MRVFRLCVASFAIVILGVSLVTGNAQAQNLAYPAAAGDLDSSFGTGGKVTTGFGSTSVDVATEVIVQAGNKILVAGYTASGPDAASDFALVRYNLNGTLDTSFGTGGKVATDFSGGLDRAQTVVLQSDGKIVVAGQAANSSGDDFALARYNSNGQIDTTFGGTGKVTTDFWGSSDGISALLVQPDGKIVAAGFATPAGESAYADFALARYNSNGSLDRDFGSGGKFTTDPGVTEDKAQAIVRQDDGKLVVAGYAVRSTGTRDFAVTRHLSNGDLDTTFSGDGIVLTDFTNDVDQAWDLVLQPADGKILAAGSASVSPFYSYQFAMARYNQDGSPDTGFGTNGKVTTEFDRGTDIARTILLQNTGEIVLVGSAELSTGEDFALARYTSNGTLDTTFGSNGRVTTSFSAGNDVPLNAVQQADGKIVAAGYANPPANSDIALARYLLGNVCIFSDVCPGDYFYTPVQELVSRGAISGYGDNTFRPFNNTTRSQFAKIITGAAGFNQTIPAGRQTFADVPSSNSFWVFVERAALSSLISGYNCGGSGETCDGQNRPYFRPYNNVTRGQVAKIVVSASGWTPINPQSPVFADVLPGNPFYREVATSHDRGIISGYNCGAPGEACDAANRPYFRWGNTAIRAQISKIVHLAVTSELQKK